MKGKLAEHHRFLGVVLTVMVLVLLPLGPMQLQPEAVSQILLKAVIFASYCGVALNLAGVRLLAWYKDRHGWPRVKRVFLAVVTTVSLCFLAAASVQMVVRDTTEVEDVHAVVVLLYTGAVAFGVFCSVPALVKLWGGAIRNGDWEQTK